MPVQTSYTTRLAAAYEGMIANSEDHTIISMVCESAAGIGFGKVAVKGTLDNQIRVSQATTAFRGITEASHTAQNMGADSYAQYENVPVIVKGVVWVVASVAVAVGDPVYFVPATGVLTNVVGANVLIPNAIWDSSTTGASQLARLRLG